MHFWVFGDYLIHSPTKQLTESRSANSKFIFFFSKIISYQGHTYLVIHSPWSQPEIDMVVVLACVFRDVKPSMFITELERGRKTATFLLQKVPHIIPHKEVRNRRCHIHTTLSDKKRARWVCVTCTGLVPALTIHKATGLLHIKKVLVGGGGGGWNYFRILGEDVVPGIQNLREVELEKKKLRSEFWGGAQHFLWSQNFWLCVFSPPPPPIYSPEYLYMITPLFFWVNPAVNTLMLFI